MNILYAFIENGPLEDIAGFVSGWQKVAIWNDLTLSEKLFFKMFYGKKNLYLRFEYA